MLLNYGEHAKKGMQAGVKGVQIEFPDPANASLPDDVKIRSIGLLDPGFLVGPPGYFGNVSLDEEVAQRLGIPAAPFVVPLRLEPAPGQTVEERVKEVTALGEAMEVDLIRRISIQILVSKNDDTAKPDQAHTGPRLSIKKATYKDMGNPVPEEQCSQ
ncbi:MAG: hypothetical protein Q9205_006191 [Flavoplaca limonia]